MSKAHKNSGLGLVEMIIVIAILATTFTALLQLVILERRTQNIAHEELAAYTIARESLEAVRGARDADWTTFANLQLSVPYYPVLIASSWQLSVQSTPAIGMYTRWVELSQVLRDGNDNIVESSGAADPDSRRITAHVTWNTTGGEARSIQLETILTNWQAFQ